MPGTVLTVASGKGGVGKTTTAVNLSIALWQEGNTVALVDADLEMANLAAVLSIEPGPTLHDVLAGEATAEEAVVEAKNGDLLVLPGTSDLAGFADADPGRLQLVVSDLADRCDYVIVDTGAGLSYEDVLPLGMADAVLLVTTPDPAAIGDTRKTLQLAGLVDAPVLGVVVTRALEATDAPSIARQLDTALLGRIPEDAAVTESAIRGDPLESHAPHAPATVAYRELAETIVDAVRGDDVEAPSAEPADVDAQRGDTTDGRSSESDE
jgi:septum site-determining protein MinD